MLPPSCRGDSAIEVHLTKHLTVMVVSGTYGDGLDPNFDCGSGPPDMVIGLNAGLFAYESWRSVICIVPQESSRSLQITTSTVECTAQV
jgi:hypothetical protein